MYESYDRLKLRIKQRLPLYSYQWALSLIHLLEAMLANIRYGFPARKMKFVGVTGTNGKTTTANLIAAILEADGHTVGLNSTAVLQIADQRGDNDLGLTTANPFLLQKLLREMRKAKCDWVVMEVASHALVQHRVWGIRFHVTVFTNLSRDHLDYHGSMDDYAKAKGRLFAHDPDVMVLNRDDKWFEFFDQFKTEHRITYGTRPEADCRIVAAKLGLKGTLLKFQLDGQKLDVRLHLPGKFNAYNAIAAAATTYAMAIPLDHIRAGLEKIHAIPGRFEMIDEGQNFWVIVDHAHTPDSLQQLYQLIRTHLKGRLITILGADGDRDPGKRTPLGKVAAEHSQLVIVTDQEPHTEDPGPIRRALLKGVESVKYGVKSYEIPDRREAIRKALSFARAGDAVVIPGMGNQPTRAIGEERIAWDERQVTRELLQELVKKPQ